MNPVVALRPVRSSDISTFFAHQCEPEALAMSGHTPRDREAFFAHWQSLLTNRAIRQEAVICDGEVAGYVCRFEQEGTPSVAYWIGRSWWGRGVATQALQLLIGSEGTRPIYGRLAPHNVASRRVLEKCGFVFVAVEQREDGDDEVVMRLE